MRVLIVKTSSLGDIIHAFPVLAYLKDQHPQIEIDWVVEKPFAELVRAHPYVSEVYTIDTKQWRRGRKWGDIFRIRKTLKSSSYDVVFDLQGNSKSALVTHWANSSNKVGYSERLVFEKPNLWATTDKFDPPEDANVREENLFLVQSFFKDNKPFEDKGIRLTISCEQQEEIGRIFQNLPNKRKVMVCPGSAWKNKQLDPEVLSDFLADIPDTHFALIWGSQEEKALVEQMSRKLNNASVIQRLPIPMLQNLMDRMDEVIAMDSLPLHLAATTSVSTYSIFGASSAQKYKPFGARHRSFQGDCPYGEVFSRRCSKLRSCKTGACIRSLTSYDLLKDYCSPNKSFNKSANL